MMANILIDGTITKAELRRAALGQSIFETLSIRARDGSEHSFKKLIVPNALKDLLVPGVNGRFYLHSFVDQKGLQGIRTAHGAHYAFPRNAERLFAVMALLNLFVLITWLMLDGEVRMLPTMFGGLTAACWFGLRSVRFSARQHFDADGGAAPAQPRNAPATSL
jgi:hypothetical protein